MPAAVLPVALLEARACKACRLREQILDPMPTTQFYLLAQECDLAKAALLGAFTAFSYVDAGKPGTMYSAFFQAATGLERLMKLVVVIDHNVKHDLNNPTDGQLKSMGHDIVVLYDRCAAIADELSISTSPWFQKEEDHERKMLVFLSRFAKGARYYNLDVIGGLKNAPDPIGEWVELHQLIAEQHISYKSRVKLNEEAINYCESLKAYGFARWPDGQYMPFVDICYLTNLLQKANPYCVWTLVCILKPFYELLNALCHRAHEIEIARGIDDPVTPYATEFFPFLLSTLDLVKRRKAWTGLY